MELHFKVTGMHCASCETLIKDSVGEIPGVKNVVVSFATGDCQVTMDDYVQSEKIHQAIDNLQGLSTGGGYLDDARDDVVHALTAWDEFLLIGGDQASVREQFVAIGTKHPWLNTLVWFIIVNRL